MENMSFSGICFSPTGTTQKLTCTVLSALGEGECTDVTVKAIPKSFDCRTCVVFGVPVFSGRVPPVAAKRLREVHGTETPAVALVVYGNRAYEDALLELKTILEHQGFTVIAAGAFVAQHSVAPSIAKGRPDEQDIALAKQFGMRAAQKLSVLDALVPLDVPGHTPYREYKPIPFTPRAAKFCTACGICAKECPVCAISRNDPRKVDSNKCISCMRCVAVCPNHQRKLSKLQTKVAQLKLSKECKAAKQPEFFL